MTKRKNEVLHDTGDFIKLARHKRDCTRVESEDPEFLQSEDLPDNSHSGIMFRCELAL